MQFCQPPPPVAALHVTDVLVRRGPGGRATTFDAVCLTCCRVLVRRTGRQRAQDTAWTHQCGRPGGD